ncbi:MAG: hypothetical protein H0T51_08855 [Pirellulales bacterium]|nr:hypothetical protein [Pirellulales bacterium]
MPLSLALSCRLARHGLLSGVVALMFVCGVTSRGADAGQELGRIKIKPLQEVSGIAASRRHEDVLWMHNDGEAKHVFAVKTSGKVAAQVKIPEAVEDVEDMAIGPGPEEGVDYLYLGDIGDNDGNRREVRVIRFAEPSLDHERGQPKVRDAEVIRLQYPDGPHDAEALLVDSATGDLIIVTKEDRRARAYVARAASLSDQVSHVTLEESASPDVGLVSAGDISSDGHWVLLRNEEQGWLWERAPGESLADALQRPPQLVPARGRTQGNNGESIAFGPVGQSYYTVSEGKDERIYEFRLPRAVTPASP